MRGFLLAGTASSVGKTLTTVALVLAFRARGVRVLTAKTGPDFLDTGYLAWASGFPCVNLDRWMLGESGISRLVAQQLAEQPDLFVCEGAMGLYDGGESSSAALAAALDLPVLLLLSAKGLGESIAALATGFLSFAASYPNLRFLGLMASHVGSARHAEIVANALAPISAAYRVPYLGACLRANAPTLAARHLGLLGVHESVNNLDPQKLVAWISTGFDLEACVRALDLPDKGSYPCASAKPATVKPCVRAKKTIALAMDAAFFFCYADLVSFFASLGCRVEVFSPLTDSRVPPCQGIFLPGGYPECFAKELSQNTRMRASLCAANKARIPIYAECGGFLYLFERLVLVDGTEYPMLGLLPGTAQMTSSLQGLGYRLGRSWDWPRPGYEVVVRGHEFHYARVETASTGDEICPLWTIEDKRGTPLGTMGFRTETLAGSWLHVPPEGGRDFYAAWVELLS